MREARYAGTKTRLWIKAGTAWVFIQDRGLRTDGFSSAQIGPPHFDLVRSCALRAPTVFSARIKTIRAENTVMNKSKDGVGIYSKWQLCINEGHDLSRHL
jgi:hypothetical protein